MKHLKYKGYLGTVEPDFENNVLYGKLVFIRDLVTYEASTLAELEQEFKTSVDLYLQSCVEDGKEPDTPFKGVFNVRLDPELHRRVAEMAMEEDLSLNAFVNKALEKEVSNHRAGA
ncbi:type II toxin-antitoxin system HicB family antitoxin [Salmonella enterica subsp. enterica serovar Infantis]|nr:type II toxin-antitoxin system HicB family antitoxin [Salmonella enterica subsp. enterica serovar Infantis]ECM9661086.1 type II toxin-antitoxin system HicB family antitoxin [Salmonella enterica subsp. enterica serovar Infantis]ECY7903470.1 type II toxin-antitoxin system HicB family antitoxin [Salmonella enterica subsp. enterica serovar Infantis]